jgi:hypothetical protein
VNLDIQLGTLWRGAIAFGLCSSIRPSRLSALSCPGCGLVCGPGGADLRQLKELGDLVHEKVQKKNTCATQQTDGYKSSDDDDDEVSQELLPADDWATQRSLWHFPAEDPRETSGVSASVDSEVRAEGAEEEGAVCSTPGVPPPSTPALAMTTSNQQPQQQPPGLGDQEERSPNPTSAEKPSARKRTAGTRNAGADIRCVS